MAQPRDTLSHSVARRWDTPSKSLNSIIKLYFRGHLEMNGLFSHVYKGEAKRQPAALRVRNYEASGRYCPARLARHPETVY